MVNLHKKINNVKAKIPHVNDILQALNRGLDDAYEDIDKTVNNMFIKTADRGALERYADIFNVKVIGRTDNQIRQQIITKIGGTGVVNPDFLQAMASAFDLGEIRVAEHIDGDYVVTITFVDIMGEPANQDAFEEALAEIFPAHLGIKFLLIFMTWDEHDTYDYSWDEWDSLNLMWNDKEKYKSLLMMTLDEYLELEKAGRVNPDREYHIVGVG